MSFWVSHHVEEGCSYTDPKPLPWVYWSIWGHSELKLSPSFFHILFDLLIHHLSLRSLLELALCVIMASHLSPSHYFRVAGSVFITLVGLLDPAISDILEPTLRLMGTSGTFSMPSWASMILESSLWHSVCLEPFSLNLSHLVFARLHKDVFFPPWSISQITPVPNHRLFPFRIRLIDSSPVFSNPFSS